MKIDNAIKTFMEKYNREAIQSIDEVSKDYALNISDSKIKAFNLNESFNIFNQYIRGYANYKIENVNNPNASTRDTIKESVEKFVNTQIFKETYLKYSELPSLITDYTNGINLLIETVDQIKSDMIDADINQEDIGDINEFTDLFIDKLHESFYPTMTRILWASGYKSKNKLYNKDSNSTPKVPTFL